MGKGMNCKTCKKEIPNYRTNKQYCSDRCKRLIHLPKIEKKVVRKQTELETLKLQLATTRKQRFVAELENEVYF